MTRAVAMFAVLLAGCGAMRNGPTQRVRLNSVPARATVVVDGQTHQTPIWVTLARDRPHEVTFSLEAFAPTKRIIRSRRDPAVIMGNCLLLCIPLLWEWDAPAAFRLEPAEVDVILYPEGWSPR
jgi:hypothetical protein